MNQRRDADEVARIGRVPLGLEVLDDGLDVDGVPEGDDVEHEAECAKLFLLAFPVACGEFAATTVTDPPGEAVAEFQPVELDEDAPALLAIIDVVEHMARLDDTSEFGECTGEWRRAFLHLKHAHDRIGLDACELERTGQAQEVWPSAGDEFGIDVVAWEPIECTVVGAALDAPEAGEVAPEIWTNG